MKTKVMYRLKLMRNQFGEYNITQTSQSVKETAKVYTTLNGQYGNTRYKKELENKPYYEYGNFYAFTTDVNKTKELGKELTEYVLQSLRNEIEYHSNQVKYREEKIDDINKMKGRLYE